MARVYAPNMAYNGVSATVRFVSGVGECADPVLLGWFERHGYRVETDHSTDKPTEKMTKDELLAKAAELELAVPPGADKATVLSIVQGKLKG